MVGSSVESFVGIVDGIKDDEDPLPVGFTVGTSVGGIFVGTMVGRS